jgi:3-oxoacyl-[acyl-carrier protein] reductase
MQLKGKVAVVTGGRQGIGQAVSIRLAAEDAHVAILDIDSADETCRQIEDGGGTAWTMQTDITDEAAVDAAFTRLEHELGPPAVLANVAGVFADIPFVDTPPDAWDRVMAVNARGTFLCGQRAARAMIRAREGRIVNILSTAAEQGFALEAAYCASKGAVLLLTKVMAIELAPYGITVNGVGPGTVQTPMGAAYLAGGPIAEHELRRTPLQRLGQPEDIAEAVAFLATRASWITGQAIYVDGGFLAAGLPLLEGMPGTLDHSEP